MLHLLPLKLEVIDWQVFDHFAVHSIDNELEDSTQIKPVVRTALALCSTVYIMTSIFGFLLFGDGTLDDVLANFDTDLGIPFGSILNDAVRVSYAAHLMLVFPIVFYPLRINLDGLFFPTAKPLARDNTRFALLSVGIIFVIFLGANFIPSIWDAFQFTGATAAVCLGFIFPAAVTLRWVLLDNHKNLINIKRLWIFWFAYSHCLRAKSITVYPTCSNFPFCRNKLENILVFLIMK